MTYFESAEGWIIDRDRSRREVLAHNGEWQDFLAEVGERDEYEAQEVLVWLGY